MPDGSPAADHRLVAAGFTERVLGVAVDGWHAPSPCEGWAARDVVRHLVEWLPAFLRSGSGIELPAGPTVDEDPVASWLEHSAAVQGLLDDPACAGRRVSNPNTGEQRLDEAIAMVYTPDVFLHTWDLARATGQDETLDPGRCAQLLAGMEAYDEALRVSGHYGPRTPAPVDADPQTRLLAFIGRTP